MKRTLSILSLAVFLLTALCLPGAMAEGEKLSPEPVTMEMMVYEHASVPWKEDAVVLQEIFEKTNIQLKITAVPQADYATKLNVLLSTNQMPDIVKTVVGGYGTIKTYASSGIFLNLSDYMAEYAPNYYARYQATPNIKMYDFEGSTYGFCLLSDESNVAFGPTLVLRYDLLEKNGIPMPTTTEELLSAMQKLKELYPESQPWTCRGSTTSLLNRSAFILGSGFNVYFEPETGRWEYAQITESFKTVLDYLHRAYASGVLDIDYATMNNQLWQEKMNTGKSFMYFENPGFSVGMTNNLRITEPDALLSAAPVPVNSVTGTARSYLYDFPEDAFYLVSADVENPELVVKFLDWCYSDEGTAVCNYGKEGVTFEYDENGQPQFKKEYVEQFANEASISYAVQSDLGACQLGFAPRYVTTNFDNAINTALGLDFDPLQDRLNNQFQTDPAYIPSVIKPPFTENENETITDIMEPINTYLATQYDRFIMGEAEISDWDAVVERLKEMDIQTVVDIYNAAYVRALGK